MNFYHAGPFNFPKKPEKYSRWQQEFWNKVEDWDEGLSVARGCYVMGLINGKNCMPWYVGKADGEEGFFQEVFSERNLGNYRKHFESSNGQPVILLTPSVTAGWTQFSKKSTNNEKPILWLEKMLIGLCLARNPDLLNIKEAMFLRNVYVDGIMNTAQGRHGSATKFARNLILGAK